MTRTLADAAKKFIDEIARDTRRGMTANVQVHKAGSKTTHYITVHENGKLRVFSDLDSLLAWLTPALASNKQAPGTVGTAHAGTAHTATSSNGHGSDGGQR